MKNELLIKIMICLCYYHICGLATTNILRLTKGNTVTILNSKCSCSSCNANINPFMQLPIISYVIAKGKCLKCGSKIPLDGLILEIGILFGMCFCSVLFSFSPLSVLFSFLLYEIVRIIVIVIKGKRETEFGKQYAIAVAMMVIMFVLVEFIALINTII